MCEFRPLGDDWLNWDPEFICDYPHMPQAGVPMGCKVGISGAKSPRTPCNVRQNVIIIDAIKYVLALLDAEE
jgi:hypothetical protein